MKKLLIITGSGNVVDTIATFVLFGRGFHETNPVMRQLLQRPALFAIVKVCAMTAALLLLWKNREHKAAIITSRCAAVLYGAIAIYYVLFFSLMTT